jgi:uncharacterized LabA/DUF88 family protein
MSFPRRYALLIDGAFLIRKIESRAGFPSARDIQAVANAVASHESVVSLSRLRVYFYHARPASGRLTNPISKKPVNLAGTRVSELHDKLLMQLEGCPDFALRLGETSTVGWRVGTRAFTELLRNPRELRADDLVPAIEQKGVDLRIGLDIARLALAQSVEAIVVVTGDSDLVPAFKFARREGLRVFLCSLGHGVKRQLRAHAARTLDVSPCAAISRPRNSRVA